MSRQTVAVIETHTGRRPDYDGSFNDAVYWDDDRPEAEELSKGEVSIIPQ